MLSPHRYCKATSGIKGRGRSKGTLDKSIFGESFVPRDTFTVVKYASMALRVMVVIQGVFLNIGEAESSQQKRGHLQTVAIFSITCAFKKHIYSFKVEKIYLYI